MNDDPQRESEAAVQGRAFEYQNVHWLWLSAVVLVADQVTKQLVVKQLGVFERIAITPFFNLTHVHNTGAAFSFMSGASPVFFISLAVVVSVGILIWLRRHPRGEVLNAAGLCLILAGAVGNAIDRATRGYVIDFLDFHAAGWHWPAFNVADMGICVGAGLLIFDMLFLAGRRQQAS